MEKIVFCSLERLDALRGLQVLVSWSPLLDPLTLPQLCQNYMTLCVRIGKIDRLETAVKRLNRYQ